MRVRDCPKSMNDVRDRLEGDLKETKITSSLERHGVKIGGNEETARPKKMHEEFERLQSTLCDLVDVCFFDFLLDFFSGFSTVSPPRPRSFLSGPCPDGMGVCLTPGYVA